MPARRAGVAALEVFAASLDARVIIALEGGPLSLRELRQSVGAPPPTTLRKRLGGLEEGGLVERRRLDRFPGTQEVELTADGRRLLSVAEALRAWLSRCPDGSIELGTMASRAALGALAEGWSSLMVRALASRPLSLTELDRLITSLNYPSLERRFDSLRVMGLIQSCAERGRAIPYTVTPWLRAATMPLLAAARWERITGTRQASPIRRRDIEGALLLAAPLLRVGARVSGQCRVRVGLDGRRGVGGSLRFDRGRAASCSTDLTGPCSATIDGPVDAWLDALFEGRPSRLEMSGDLVIAREVAAALARPFDGITVR